jgi:hypothetical protein
VITAGVHRLMRQLLLLLLLLLRTSPLQRNESFQKLASLLFEKIDLTL